jgi:nucleoside-diphosphate-sugar epimerase
MKILLIGGNGYAGSTLYNHFKTKNYDVDSVDLCLFGEDLGFSIKTNYNNFYTDNYSHIVLLAAHSSVKMADYNKENAWLNNVSYFYELCSKLKEHQTLIYASSASVYGRNPGLSTEDQLNLYPINNYDLTKITNDIIANNFIHQNKKIVGLRFGTINGVSKNIRSDLMINSMYYSAKTQNKILIKNSNIHRPILSTKDLVNSIDKLINSRIVSGQYNISSFNSTVKEIAQTVSEIWNVPIIDQGDDNYSDVYDFMLDTSLFSMTYNFQFKETIKDIASDFETLDSIDNFLPRNDDRLFNSYI